MHLGISEAEWAKAERAGLERFDEIIYSEERFRVIFEYAPDAYFLTDLKGTFIQGNRTAEKLTGYRREEIVGKSFLSLSLLSAAQMAKVTGVLVKNAMGQPSGPDEFVLRRKDGSQVPVEISTCPVNLNSRIVVLGIAHDITERKKTEREMEKLASVVRNSSEIITLATIDGKLTFLNEAGRTMLGVDPADMEKTSILDVLAPHLHKMGQETILSALMNKGVWKGDLQYRNLKTGKLTEAQATTFTIGDPDTGRPLYLANVSIDISERKEAEKALAKSEERFRTVFEEAPIGMAMADKSFRFFRANDAFCRMLGYTEAALASLTFQEITREDQIGVDLENIKKLAAGLIPFYRTEKPYVRKDGAIVWGRLTLKRISDEDGTAPYYLAMIEDITERKAAADALGQSEQKYRELADSLPTPIFEADTAGRVTFANKTAYEWFGYTAADLAAGPNVLRMLAEPDRLRAATNFQRVVAVGESSSGEYVLERKDASTFPGMVVARVLVQDGKPSGLQGIVIDISERKRAELELQKTTGMLRETLGHLINVVATTVEVRDPYTAGHQRRVSNLARAIATEMGLPKDQIEGIRVAGVIHDIGKISVPSEILSKPGKLSEIELALISTHPQVGYKILKDISFPWPIAQIVYQHHERMNGSGYPRKLKGKAILLEARILAVADVMEAMSSHRPYRSALGLDRALEEISANKGRFYDPDVVDACVRIFSERKFDFEA